MPTLLGEQAGLAQALPSPISQGCSQGCHTPPVTSKIFFFKLRGLQYGGRGRESPLRSLVPVEVQSLNWFHSEWWPISGWPTTSSTLPTVCVVPVCHFCASHILNDGSLSTSSEVLLHPQIALEEMLSSYCMYVFWGGLYFFLLFPNFVPFPGHDLPSLRVHSQAVSGLHMLRWRATASIRELLPKALGTFSCWLVTSQKSQGPYCRVTELYQKCGTFWCN